MIKNLFNVERTVVQSMNAGPTKFQELSLEFIGDNFNIELISDLSVINGPEGGTGGTGGTGGSGGGTCCSGQGGIGNSYGGTNGIGNHHGKNNINKSVTTIGPNFTIPAKYENLNVLLMAKMSLMKI